MNKKQFEILRIMAETKNSLTQRIIAQKTGFSLGSVNSIVTDLIKAGLSDEEYRITEKGLVTLEPYKVKNAIILAAGMSTRFIPISYELPKGLISVKGEVMTERLIRQLHEAGIDEIVLVVGYMMEKFFYLREKYGVKFVVNNEYALKNTHSSVYAARDFLSNTYIICSDNYYPNNMFHQYEYRAFYCSVYLPGTSYTERAFIFGEENLIVDTNKPSHNQWIMYGHAYFDKQFTKDFKQILEDYYGRSGIEYMYWETIYAENVDKLKMWGLKCSDNDILEFDNMEELKQYDPQYIYNNKVSVFENICKILCCELSDITDIQPVNAGLNNRSFKFLCNGEEYIYRHPGKNALEIIDRKKEASALRAAKKLIIDETLLYIDEIEGWKISKYISVTETFDFSNMKHISLLAEKLKVLHDSDYRIGFTFDYRKEAEKMLNIERFVDSFSYRNLVSLNEKMKPIFNWLDNNKWQESLCHNDLYEPNLLIKDKELSIIDWEFAGDNDIGYDICKLFAVNNSNYEDMDKWLYPYFGRLTTEEEKLHLLACAAIIYYYWYVWGIYASKRTPSVSDYMLGWYEKMNHFSEEVLKRI